MPTPLHDVEALRALAAGPPGEPRDWALVHLAARGIDAGLPDDPVAARSTLIAGGSAAPLLARLAGGRKELAAAAAVAEEVCRAGALPQDASPWVAPLTAAIRGRGWSSDASLARLLAELGHHDPAVLGAAARAEDPEVAPQLARAVLGFAEAAGRDVDAVAISVAGALAPRMSREPGLQGELLAALGVPRITPERPIADLEAGLTIGGSLAGADETPPVSPGRGAQRRRMRSAAAELVDGAPGAAAAMIRALLVHDGPDAGLLLAAATWVRCVPADVAAAVAVVEHAAGESPALLSRAATEPTDAASLSLALGVAHQADPPAAALAARSIAAGRSGAELLVDALLRSATALSEPRLQAALTLALARDPSPVLRWLDQPGMRPLALYHARHTAHEEVLASLLEGPEPKTAHERALFGRALSSQGDRAALDALVRLRDRTGDEALDAEVDRARAIVAG